MSAPMKPSEALRKARELITQEAAWIQGTISRDEKGDEIGHGWNPKAVCWCAYGALEKITGEHWGRPIDGWFRKVDLDNCVSLDEFNDTHSHAEVLAAFDAAAALAEAAGQ